MKNYRTLARKEVLSQKLTSFLILTAVILSTMMTAAVAGVCGPCGNPVLPVFRQIQGKLVIQLLIPQRNKTSGIGQAGILFQHFLGYTGGHILGLAGQGTAKAVLPPEYLYYSVDIRTESKKNFQSVMDDLGEKLEIHELDTLYNVPLLNALGISFDAEAADTGSQGFGKGKGNLIPHLPGKSKKLQCVFRQSNLHRRLRKPSLRQTGVCGPCGGHPLQCPSFERPWDFL